MSRDSLATLFDRALTLVERLYRERGLEGMTDNQKILFTVHDVNWSNFVEYFNRDLAVLDEVCGDAEPTEAEWLQHQKYKDEFEEWHNWAAEGLRRIGAPKAAKAFERARETCDWDKWQERFHRAEDVDELLHAFVAEHADEFRI